MKKIKLSEEQLTKLVKQVLEQNVEDKEVMMALGDVDMLPDGDIEDDSKRIKLNKDMFGSLGDDDNMNEAIKRFNRLI